MPSSLLRYPERKEVAAVKLKRLFDVLVCSAGIIVLAPLFVVISLIIKLESRGPVFYRCQRVGKDGVLFDMLKFRTMVDSADNVDCKLCGKSDVRVTSFGQILRKTKLNELPQLLNVIAGDMSLVGPRPEDPKFIGAYADKWKIVLSVKPGVVGPNQIVLRNEEDLFPSGVDPESYYVNMILPKKLDTDIEYARKSSLWGDFLLVLKGVYVTLFHGNVDMKSTGKPWVSAHAIADMGLSSLALFLAYAIRNESLQFDEYIAINMAMAALINVGLFTVTGFYRIDVRFFSLDDSLSLLRLVPVGAAILFACDRVILPFHESSPIIFVVYTLISFLFIGGYRVGQRILIERKEVTSTPTVSVRNTVIYGAGRLGSEILRRLQFEPCTKVIGLVDDDPCLRKKSILGVPVLGTGRDLAFLKSLYKIETAVIAFTPSTSESFDYPQQCCIRAGIFDVRVVSPPFNPTETNIRSARPSRRARLSDELGMDEVWLSGSATQLLSNSVVAILGGGDRIGEHLCRELAHAGASKIVVVDDNRAGLSMVADTVPANGSKTKFSFHFHPLGFHEMTMHVLADEGVQWVICNHLNRPGHDWSPDGAARFVTTFVQTVRYVEMARHVPCEMFTLVSPWLSDSFSQEEKWLHLLSENYLTVTARRNDGMTRFGTVRIPNTLEDETGVILRHCRKVLDDPSFPLSDSPIRCSSARYTARVIMNTLPAQHAGEIFVQSAGLVRSLRDLVDLHARRLQPSKRASVLGRLNDDARDTSEPVRGNTTPKGCVETDIPNVWLLAEQQVAKVNEYESLIQRHVSYLSPREHQATNRFFQHMQEYFEMVKSTTVAAEDNSSGEAVPTYARTNSSSAQYVGLRSQRNALSRK